MPDNLQFDRAEPTPGTLGVKGVMSCTVCGSLLGDTYYVINGHVVCDKCRRSVEADWNRGGAAGRFGKALGLGILAAIVCSLAWYGVLAATNRQWGILAIIVGLVVGSAVRKGSNGRGGWRYQALAIVLTYTAIASSYVPFIRDEMRRQDAEMTKAATTPGKVQAPQAPQAPVDSTAAAAGTTPTSTTTDKISPVGVVIGAVILLVFLYISPFFMGGLLGVLIVGFALYEAWKLNRRAELRVSGPHRVSMTAASA